MGAVRDDVIAYLRENLKRFPIDQLRAQLSADGVSDYEIDEALRIVLRAPTAASGINKAAPKNKAPARLLIAGGVVIVGIVAVLVATGSRTPSAPPAEPTAAPTASAVEGGFVGRGGWVIGLPKDYSAIQGQADPKRSAEVVHFARGGTDPTNFLHEGLFGQLGIVRLEVRPSPLAGTLSGPDSLSATISGRLAANGDKFTVKPLQVGSLRGVQFTIEPPNAGVEGYLLGRQLMYRFTAGQEDEIYRELVNSLRDPHSEQ